MRLLLSLVFLLGVIGCTTEEQEGLYLFNDLSFNVQEGETVQELSKDILSEYESYIFNSDLQIPLYKCIKGDRYTIFLGLPYQLSPRRIAEAQGMIEAPISFESSPTSSLLTRMHEDGTYSTECLVPLNENLLFVLATTQSEIIADSLLTRDALTSRFVSSNTHE